jgi:hypothetical protein
MEYSVRLSLQFQFVRTADNPQTHHHMPEVAAVINKYIYIVSVTRIGMTENLHLSGTNFYLN